MVSMFDSLREQLPVALGSFSPSPANIRQRTMDHKHLLSPSDSIYYLTPVCRARSGAQSPVQLSLPSRCLENSRVAGKKSFLSHLSKYKPVLPTLLSQGAGYDLIHMGSWDCTVCAEHKALNLGSL